MTSPRILLLVPDLFFLAKISSTARELGISTSTLLQGQDPVEAVRREGARALIVDLDLEGGDPLAAAARFRAEPTTGKVRIVGFFSHVQAETRSKALASGFDVVLPRSKFAAELPFLLRELASTPGGG